MKRKITSKTIHGVILFVLLILNTSWINAQAVTISGTVTASDDGSRVTGANVYIKGTSTGTVTDVDGKFSLEANKGDVIVISFIGYLSEEITVGTQTTINVSLNPDLINLNEIVVVGYGTQKKSDLTGSVATVSSDELNRKPTATFEQSLQGLAPGVMVISNSGNPGAGATVQIRGVSSITNSSPLYIIDGVPSFDMSSTDPSDIASISVLKDAAACAIYGSRAANGVILITTTKGKKGFHVNFESQFGIQKEWKRLDLLDAEEYSKYDKEVNDNLRRTRNYSPSTTISIPSVLDDPARLANNTDWQEEMFRDAPIQKYNLALSGANDLVTYNVSGIYFNQQGIMLSSGFERYNVRANSELKYKMIRVGENIALNSSIRNNEKNNVGGRSQVERMLKQTPLVPVYDTTQLGGFAGPFPEDEQDAVNPVGVAKLYKDQTKTKGILGNIYAEIEFLKNFKYKVSYGVDLYNREKDKYEPAYEMGSYQRVGTANWDSTFIESRTYLFENWLTYTKDLNKHHVDVTLGYSWQKTNYSTVQNLSSLVTAETIDFVPGRKNHYYSGLISYFGRVNYSFANKYLLQANMRYDGSSKFGPDVSRYAAFPSFSGGWVVSKENFFQGVNFISFFKLRGSWGQLGNQNIADYQYETATDPFQRYVFNDIVVSGTGITAFSNDAVKWETKTSINAGTDISFFKNRINFSGDYYHETSEDMLIYITLPESNGTSVFPARNAGTVRNTGVELSLNYRNQIHDFKYSITGNLTTIHNEVIDLNPSIPGTLNDIPLTGGASELGNSTLTAVGQPIGSFYGFVTDGVYKSEDEIDPIFAPVAVVGDIKYKDLAGPVTAENPTGGPDGRLTDADKTFIGSPIPTLTYGLNLTAEYKGFDLSLTFQGVHGNSIYRETKCWTEGMYSNFNASTDVNNRFRATDFSITTTDPNGDPVVANYTANTNTDMPWAVRGDPNNNALRFSDRFIEDGSYLRLKDITLGYSLPSDLIRKIKASRIRIYLVGANVLTFTKYSGYDPEIGVTNLQDEELRNSNLNPQNLSRGIDNGYYPQARSIIGGIQLSF